MLRRGCVVANDEGRYAQDPLTRERSVHLRVSRCVGVSRLLTISEWHPKWQQRPVERELNQSNRECRHRLGVRLVILEMLTTSKGVSFADIVVNNLDQVKHQERPPKNDLARPKAYQSFSEPAGHLLCFCIYFILMAGFLRDLIHSRSNTCYLEW